MIVAKLLLLRCYGQEQIQVVTEDWPPYNFMLPNGEVGGRTTEIVRKVLDRAGIDYEIRLFPWARSYEMAKNRENVLVYSILRTKKREKLFKWICPVSQRVVLRIYTLSKRKDLNIKSMSDAKKYLVGVTRGDYPHIHLLELGFDLNNMALSPSDKDNIKLLLNNRIDFVIESEETMATVLAKEKVDASAVRAIEGIDVGHIDENCMAFGIKTKDILVQQIQKALDEVNAQRGM